MRTQFDLNGDVTEAFDADEPLLVDRRLQRRIRHQRYHRGAMAGTDLPDMQIGHQRIAIALHGAPNTGRNETDSTGSEPEQNSRCQLS